MRRIVGLGMLFLVVAVLWWGTAMWELLPSGSGIFQQWSLLWAIALTVSLFALPLALIAAVFRKVRRPALRVSAVCAVIIAGWFVGLKIGVWQRYRHFEEIPHRAAPLVAAIHAFERDQGRPPHALEELLPRYLGAIPPTGFGGHPKWQYREGPFTGEPTGDGVLLGENPWVLNLYIVTRLAPGHRFLYLPNRRYPENAPRTGEWARLHY